MRSQNGYSLVELILVIGLTALGTILAFQDKQRDLEVAKARETGALLYQYNNAVRAWLSSNVGAANATRSGSAWLKLTSCGGLSSIEYLPCSYPAATAANPITYGRLALSSDIATSGVAPNQVTTVTTSSSPFMLSTSETRADLAGASTLMAASGVFGGATPALMATDGSYKSNPTNATITMVASNNGATDAWLRTDGSNTMNNNLKFNSASAANMRQLENVSRIQNIATQILYLGNSGGASLGTPERLIVDADQTLLGKLVVSNVKTGGYGVDVIEGSIRTRSGNISSSGTVLATGNVQSDSNIVAAGTVYADRVTSTLTVAAGTDVNAAGRVTAGADIYSTGGDIYTTSGNITSSNNMSAQHLILTKVEVSGTACSPSGQIAKSVTGSLLSCESGAWKSSAAGLGVGQAWLDVRPSRSMGATYTNTTAAPIAVQFAAYVLNAGGWGITGYINGSVASNCSGGNYEDRCNLFTIVPAGSTYSFVMSGGGLQNYQWRELR
jgi:hypothetical protein